MSGTLLFYNLPLNLPVAKPWLRLVTGLLLQRTSFNLKPILVGYVVDTVVFEQVLL
jgi:hypothetical protein